MVVDDNNELLLVLMEPDLFYTFLNYLGETLDIRREVFRRIAALGSRNRANMTCWPIRCEIIAYANFFSAPYQNY